MLNKRKEKEEVKMIKKISDTDFFKDPLGSMMQQSKWAFNNSIIFADTSDGEKFWSTHLFWEKEIQEYRKENKAP